MVATRMALADRTPTTSSDSRGFYKRPWATPSLSIAGHHSYASSPHTPAPRRHPSFPDPLSSFYHTTPHTASMATYLPTPSTFDGAFGDSYDNLLPTSQLAQAEPSFYEPS
jgi:hypothetical protein